MKIVLNQVSSFFLSIDFTVSLLFDTAGEKIPKLTGVKSLSVGFRLHFTNFAK